MTKENEKFTLDVSKEKDPQADLNNNSESDEELLSQMKRGFNNQYICFEYPFAWQSLKSEEDEFTDAVLFNKQNNAIVKVSTQPCLVNTIEELKVLLEEDLKTKDCEIQQSTIEKLNEYDIWDFLYLTNEGLEIEQFSILKENNLYTLELYTKNNRDQVVVKSFVDVIQTFKILKPSYKISGDSYEKI